MKKNRAKLTTKHMEICEALGWALHLSEDVGLGQYSPAGEDFIFYVSIENFVDDVAKYAANFDVDDHIEMWLEAKRNGVSGVPSARVLVEDAYAIDEMLHELASALANA
jgi:hypothetical protein